MLVVRTLQTACNETGQMARRAPIIKLALTITPEVLSGPFFKLFKAGVIKLPMLEKNPFKPLGTASQTESWKTWLKPLASTWNVDELLLSVQ